MPELENCPTQAQLRRLNGPPARRRTTALSEGFAACRERPAKTTPPKQRKLEWGTRKFARDHDAADPLASPLYGELTGLAPIRVHVGDDEVLLDDSRRYVERAVAAKVDAHVDVWKGMTHGFLSSIGTLAASAQALDMIGTFLTGRLTTEVPDEKSPSHL